MTNRLKALRTMFAWAVEAEGDMVTTNPARDVAKLRTKDTGGHHSWTIAEVRRFEVKYPVGTMPRLALALFLYTGQRRQDVARMGPANERDGWIVLTQGKNELSNPVTIALPIIPELRRIINATEIGSVSYLVTSYGKPFSVAGLGNKMREWCDAAGLHNCSAHGLRKATSARLAELGASEREIMAITGHRTASEVDRYTRGARQKVLAQSAMLRLVEGL